VFNWGMLNTKALIDGLVRQTTVLIAHVATSAGLRAPLAHVANQIFIDLTTELEQQGLGQKVIADMFGLALRSYQQKLQRLSESATDQGRTLWIAVYEYLSEKQSVRRADVLKRFSMDDEASVKAILRDLCDSGLVYARLSELWDTVTQHNSQGVIPEVTQRVTFYCGQSSTLEDPRLEA
jgi:hypothetical protein